MSDEAQASTSRVARVAVTLAVASIATAALGILGVQLGILAPVVAFYLFALGAVLGGLLSLLLGGISLFLTNGGRDPVGAKRAWLGAGGGALLLGSVVMGMAGGGGQAPPINDITTNLDAPPGYVAAAKEGANVGRDMSYPADFVSVVRESYPDLAPLRVDQSPEESYRSALAAARQLGWTIVFEDAAAGVFEAQEVSSVFHFVDDISVRVAADGRTSVVDVRSKSRDGRGDMGVNAARIRAFGGIVAPANVARP
jgi:uncharacterized protein (DUF1499 family)